MKDRVKRVSGVLLALLLITSGCTMGAGNAQPTQDPGVFYTEAAATMNAALTLNALAELNEKPTETLTPLPTETPTLEPTRVLPTDTPTMTLELPTVAPTGTPVPDEPMLHVTENTNCRAGPSPAYGVEGYVTTAMTLPVRGINEGRSWWWVQNPTYPEYNCWVWQYTSVIEGDTSNIPVYRDPWTMTPADPELTVSTTVYPRYYSGVCPQEVTVVATIHSNRAAHVRYEWLRKEYSQKMGWVTINADGSATVYQTISVKYDTTSYFNLKISYPINYLSPKIHYEIDCKAP